MSQEQNPYQSPVADSEQTERQAGKAYPDPAIIVKFREQIHALGAFWIIIGGIASGLVAMVFLGSADFLTSDPDNIVFLIVAGVSGFMGLAWVVLGVLTCLKQMWAVYTGLVLSYLSAALQLLNLNLCAIAILVIVILQAHRVIGWARKMQAMGTPLTAKPRG